MPSIEIVCLGQVEPLDFSGMGFAVVTDPTPVSHRARPLFQAELERLTGCTYHLGNPVLKERKSLFFFAYEVLSEESRLSERNRFFQVEAGFEADFRSLVEALLEASPVNRVFFTTDWQSGPARATRGGELTAPAFWELYAARKIRLNACYQIRRD